MDKESSSLLFLGSLVRAQREGEAAVQALISERLAGCGAEVSTLTYSPAELTLKEEFATAGEGLATEERIAVVGIIRGSGGGGARSLLLFGHPDGEDPAAPPPGAEPEKWSAARPPFEPTVEEAPSAGGGGGGKRMYGWGIADDLMGVAAGVCALERCVAALARGGQGQGQGRQLQGDVYFASTPSKHHARGATAVLQRVDFAGGLDAALYLHPAESGAGLEEIKALSCGQIMFSVSVAGRTPAAPTDPPFCDHPHWAASATPEADGMCAFSHFGVNPLDKALLLREALLALRDARAARVHHPTLHAAVGRSTNLLSAAVRCGFDRSFSAVPPQCELGCALSFPPTESLAEVQAEVQACLDAAVAKDGWLRENPPAVAWLSGVTGTEVRKDHPLFVAVSGCVEEVTGVAPHVNPMHTSSDIRVPLVQLGVPCLGLGSRSGNLAQDGHVDEWVDLDDYDRLVESTALIIERWCGAAADEGEGSGERKRKAGGE